MIDTETDFHENSKRGILGNVHKNTNYLYFPTLQHISIFTKNDFQLITLYRNLNTASFFPVQKKLRNICSGALIHPAEEQKSRYLLLFFLFCLFYVFFGFLLFVLFKQGTTFATLSLLIYFFATFLFSHTHSPEYCIYTV